jgi:hypothetical protein
MTDYSELKRLAEEATPGPWKAQHPNAGQRGSEVADASGLNQICADLGPTHALYIAAANPAAVLALIAENERLGGDLSHAILLAENRQFRAEIAGLKTGYAAYEDEVKGLRAEIDALRRRQQSADGYMDAFYKVASLLGIGARTLPPMEVFHGEMVPRLEAVLKDAERWRFVRNPLGRQSPYAVWREGRQVLLSQVADEAIDAAMSKEAGQ